ncbi:hypothetical protein BU15DRAFT_67089 [Melanogaster broomeanus]|nr:hypothetical protein BU15DRAFT_67089 [Melanogaster broomeanus]
MVIQHSAAQDWISSWDTLTCTAKKETRRRGGFTSIVACNIVTDIRFITAGQSRPKHARSACKYNRQTNTIHQVPYDWVYGSWSFLKSIGTWTCTECLRESGSPKVTIPPPEAPFPTPPTLRIASAMGCWTSEFRSFTEDVLRQKLTQHLVNFALVQHDWTSLVILLVAATSRTRLFAVSADRSTTFVGRIASSSVFVYSSKALYTFDSGMAMTRVKIRRGDTDG